jgi:methylated-DNA-[protein]-cysteine S-methyltransferase
VNTSPFQAVVAAPGFSLGIRCDDDEITGIEFIEPCGESVPTTPLSVEAARQMRAWLDDAAFSFGLPLRPAGTPFRQRVWARIKDIPRGETRTYGELAAAIGSGPRAVGGACGANPYPVVVPCHRVVAANGGLGGFAGNRDGFLLDVKRWLLEHEQNR